MTARSGMRAARAYRLARRADRLRDDGTRGPWALRAWRVLTSAAEAGNEPAIRALRERWLCNPRDDAWEHVSRWCTPADVLAAAVDPAREAAARAAIGTFCVRHGIVPDNAVERVLFFVLTGQSERYQALDPDGSLLASGYRGAGEGTREALRHTMIGLGELNLVRAIADRPDRLLTSAEADYLVSQIAEAGEWGQLWRLIPAVPVADAVRVARMFGDWRPADDAGRELFTRLTATEPETITALMAAAVTRFKVRSVYRFSFAPDGSELAILHPKGTTIYEPRTGRRLVNHAGRDGTDREQAASADMVALGNGVIVHDGGEGNDWSVMRCVPGQRPEVLLPNRAGASIGRTPGGFVVHTDEGLRFAPAEGGSWSQVVTKRELHVGHGRSDAGMLASDPVSGRLLMRVSPPNSERYETALLDANLRVLARGPRRQFDIDPCAFCGPEQVLKWSRGGSETIETWRRAGKRLVRTAHVDVGLLFDVAPLPTRNLAVIAQSGGLTWRDATTLAEVDRPEGFPAVDARRVAFSPDGSLAAVSLWDGGVEVHDLQLHHIAALLARPLSEMTLANLEAVEQLATQAQSPSAAAAVMLLRASLGYRFGAEVALGSSATRAIAGEHDIALGGSS